MRRPTGTPLIRSIIVVESMSFRLIGLTVLIWLSTSLCTLGQRRVPYVLGASAHQAQLLMHSPKMAHLQGTYPRGAEVNLQFQTTGAKAWHQEYQYPRFGFSFLWFDYNNPVIGQSFAISPYFSKPFHRSEKQELHLRFGSGFAFFTQRFDADSNPQNVVISNKLNAVMQARLDYDYKVTPHLSLTAALGFNHYSNGANRKPNLGLNLPTLSIGANFHSQPAFEAVQVERAPFSPQYFLDISGSIGTKRLDPDDLDKFLANSVSLLAGKKLTRKSNVVAGFEGFYDRSIYKMQRNDAKLDPEEVWPDVKRVGIVGGHELVLGKLMLETHVGLYLYRPYKTGTFYYQRLGLKYLVTDYVFSAIDLKVHAGSADVIEFRVGTRLPFSK